MTSSNEPALADPASAEFGKHRLPKQRGVSRGSTVLGVAAMAAVGASGVAAAQSKSPISIPISVQDVSDVIHTSAHAAPSNPAEEPAAAPVVMSHSAGETLLTRILAQVHQQRADADAAVREDQRKAAEAAAAKEAAAQKVRDEAARKKAEEQARQQAAAEAEAKAEQERRAQLAAELAASYIKPLTSSTLTSGFGEAGSMWSAAHTGQDFAAPTGTPAMAVHGGTITSAGWAGAYGYRVVLTLDDGTQVWYCHLSSMVKTSGKVTTGDVVGRVGATGNVTGPHLHLEIRPAGGEPVDPLAWLQERGASLV
ncbi:M23 family metallopeptidase [Streptomyces sp. RB6PN25]|uniref:M23 family metallopeptidase n=1 Tax=Streptomyces humicola TaxID=2953240 RepID=A0ABT1Q4V4_9ACTN|nr:M23 family metallopeptidase [Streptomyces humicola]MCQ4084966.1 M23 family metallopeptidase [Streptomyces humicola]